MSLSKILAKLVATLTAGQQLLLRKLAFGHHLKGQRDIEGQKLFRLYHSASNDVVATPTLTDVEELRAQGLLDSNMKFPAARFFLSPAGHQLALSLPDTTPQEQEHG